MHTPLELGRKETMSFLPINLTGMCQNVLLELVLRAPSRPANWFIGLRFHSADI